MDPKANGHAGRAHALLSASGAYRWLTCTPSARLEDQFKEDEEASVYAAEGTLAHEYSEVEIAFATDLITLEERVERLNKIKANSLYSDELEEEAGKYIDYVIDAWREAKKLDPYATLLLEDRIDLTRWIPEGFGSNDVVILAGDLLKVKDLKFGKGVKVSANDNPQLKLYALGALEKHGFLYDIKRVELTIHQPRLNSVSTFELSAEDLERWGEDFVKPRAAMAFEGKGDFVPGSHCHFCKVAPRCRALAEKNLEIAKYDFAEPELLTDEQLLDIYDRAPAFISWANKLSAYVLNEALAGKSWPGFKLVEGRSTRRITDEDAVVEALGNAGLAPSSFLNSKLKGLTDLTKLLGKKDFEAVVGPYVDKPPGKPTLVTEDDPRPVFNSIDQHKKDFEDAEEF